MNGSCGIQRGEPVERDSNAQLVFSPNERPLKASRRPKCLLKYIGYRIQGLAGAF